jgi:hypothetical protein
MRDFIIVIVLSLLAAIAADYVWLGGKHVDKAAREIGLDISAIRHR